MDGFASPLKVSFLISIMISLIRGSNLEHFSNNFVIMNQNSISEAKILYKSFFKPEKQEKQGFGAHRDRESCETQQWSATVDSFFRIFSRTPKQISIFVWNKSWSTTLGNTRCSGALWNENELTVLIMELWFLLQKYFRTGDRFNELTKSGKHFYYRVRSTNLRKRTLQSSELHMFWSIIVKCHNTSYRVDKLYIGII